MALSQVCLATRPYNGGIITMEDMCDNLAKSSGRKDIQSDDVVRAIAKLAVLGTVWHLSAFKITHYTITVEPILTLQHVYQKSQLFLEENSKNHDISGDGFQVVKVGKKRMIQSVPGELSLDHTKALEVTKAH